jgi:hypothetical protein
MTPTALTSGEPVRHPCVVNDETQALLTSLNAQREHVLGALEGLSEDELRRPLLPSGWTPLGMVQHLTLEVERFWFRGAVAGEPLTLTSGDEAWRVPAEVPGAAILGLCSPGSRAHPQQRGPDPATDRVAAPPPVRSPNQPR